MSKFGICRLTKPTHIPMLIPLKHGVLPKLTVLPLLHRQRKRQSMAPRPRFYLQNRKQSNLPDNTRPPLTVRSS
nr:MAG TPA: hypothetical protein [Caudoviricetes sp.]